jgi:hypothetical protein
MKEFRSQNHRGKNREDYTTNNIVVKENKVKFWEPQLSVVLNERKIYPDHCETMSDKMKNQTSDVLANGQTFKQ